MLPPWFERRRKIAAGAPHALQQSLEAGRIDALLRPLSSAERPDLRYFEAIARPRAAEGVLAPGRYRTIAARNGWLPWLDRMLVRRCVAHLRGAAGPQLRLLCRIDPDSLSDPAFVAELEEFADREPCAREPARRGARADAAAGARQRRAGRPARSRHRRRVPADRQAPGFARGAAPARVRHRPARARRRCPGAVQLQVQCRRPNSGGRPCRRRTGPRAL